MKWMKWHKSEPPEAGWYPAMKIRGCSWDNSYRWWDGECWSWPAFSHESAAKAAHWASKKEDKHDIEWTDRPKNWPERSKT